MIKDTVFKAISEIENRAKGLEINDKLDELKEILADRGLYPATVVVKEEKKKTHPAVIALAIIGSIAAVAAIAYCVYTYFIPEDSEDFEDFDDEEWDLEDFDDDDEEVEE